MNLFNDALNTFLLTAISRWKYIVLFVCVCLMYIFCCCFQGVDQRCSGPCGPARTDVGGRTPVPQ